MVSAEFRFYEELNDFLPPRRRKRCFEYACARRATVKQAIEALGVPHTEVEVILVNGESVDFTYLMRHGDRVSVYPQFESFDIAPLLRVRAEPLRRTRFIADAHLGALAKYLRMLGFDTLYQQRGSDTELAAIAGNEKRVVLTRDRELLMHSVVTHGCFVRPSKPRRQLEVVLERLDLYGSVKPFTRCMSCNGVLRSVEKRAIARRLPADTGALFNEFSTCTGCRKLYWKGSHYRRMCEFIGHLHRSRGDGPASTTHSA